MKPLFLFFYASKPRAKDGAPDYDEMKGCETVSEELKVRALANILREFVCVKVDASQADARILEAYRVNTVPTCMLLDSEGNLASLSVGQFAWNGIELDYLTALESADERVKTLAAGDEKDPVAAKARARLAEIHAREGYARGEKLFQRAQWDKSAEAFRDLATKAPAGNFFAGRVPAMLAEIGAARLYFEALEDLKAERKNDAKVKLERIVFEMKSAPCFGGFAKATLGKM